MRFFTIAAIGAFAGMISAQTTWAASCYDLWYQRNGIFDSAGFCFKTKLARQTFDNSDCWTDEVRLSGDDQWQVDQIKSEERRRGCRVN